MSLCGVSFCYLFSRLFSFDRSHKRYYYTNKVTGDSQWEYPSDEIGAEVKEDTPPVQAPMQAPVQAPVQSSVAATVTSTQTSLAVWSYPGKKCLP